jgi:hypothetical protein
MEASAGHQFARVEVVGLGAKMLRVFMIGAVSVDGHGPVIDGDEVEFDAHAGARGEQSGAGAAGPAEHVDGVNGSL